jgi:hypothetical protein
MLYTKLLKDEDFICNAFSILLFPWGRESCLFDVVFDVPPNFIDIRVLVVEDLTIPFLLYIP